MRVAAVLIGAALVAGACAASPSELPPTGPGTTAPLALTTPVANPSPALPALQLELITDELTEPVALALRPGTEGIYVVERLGRVVLIEDDEINDEPFLDLQDIVFETLSEQGLLGFTFDTDGDRVFVLYTDESGSVQVAGYAVDGDRVDIDSAKRILTVEQPHRYHQGGGLTFGPDGYLWISFGDGGRTGDPDGNGQNPANLLGSIVRLDVDAFEPYAVPPDNPFVEAADAAPEVWAYGLRNPWRFSFDAGLVYIADVGFEGWEEINVVSIDAAGSNFGWAIREGVDCFEADSCATEGLVPPTFSIEHTGVCAVVGGSVYRGAAIPALEGHYFYGDYCNGWIRSLVFDGVTVVAEHDWAADLGRVGHITTFGVDAGGELLVATQEGGLHRVVAEP